jgi:uncharacterized protein YjdB
VLSVAASAACTDKSYVTDLGAADVRLGVNVSLGELAADGDITAVRIVARHDSAALDRSIVLRDISVPYVAGESRDVTLTFDVANCLRLTRLRDPGATACPVYLTVDIMADARRLVRDELPVVNVRPGEVTTTPALAARGATAIRLRYNAADAPAAISLSTGNTAQLSADALDAAGVVIAGRTITWTSASSAIATVSTTGLVTAVASGAAEISASMGTGNAIVRKSTIVNVAAPAPASVLVAPASASIDAGSTQQLTATVRDANGTTISPSPTLTWQSSNTAIASVSSVGLVTAVSVGSATITARTANNVAGTATISVLPAPATVVLAPAAPSLIVGSTQTLTPTVRDVTGAVIVPTPALTWSSSASTIATVTTSGLVTAVAPGTTVITARTAGGITGTASVTVAAATFTVTLAPTTMLIGVDFSQSLAATVRDAFGAVVVPAPALTWQSGNNTIASVSASGVVTGLSIGQTTITARTASGAVGSAAVTVAATGSFTGRVYDFDTNANIAGATVSMTINSVLRTFTTDALGIYTTGTIVGATYDLRVSAPGFVTTDVRSLAVGGDRTIEATPLARTAANGGTITGDLRSAITNLLIFTPITIDLFAGQNTTTGTPIATTTSNQNGGYSFANVPTGTYTVVARASGYSESSRTTASLGVGRFSTQQTVFLSPTSSAGVLRIVLTWGTLPSDLDAHLTGPGPNASSFWVYWNSTGSCVSEPFVCLDVDQTEGRGPETITIVQKRTGRYVYSVDNFSGDATLAQSNARVDVYGPGGLLQSFGVPSQPGTLWKVFEWDGTTITAVNTMTNGAPPAAIVAGNRQQSASFEAMPVKPPKIRKR